MRLIGLDLTAALCLLGACDLPTAPYELPTPDVNEDVGDPEDSDLAGEACNEAGAQRSCSRGGGNVQYCADLSTEEEGLQWGECFPVGERTCELDEANHMCIFEDDEDEGGTGGEGEACETCTETCILHDGKPTWDSWVSEEHECNTPLVLSFDGAPVQIEPAPAATFDINAAGGCITTDWPAAVTPWLAIDLDGNGAIDNGRELFGSGTRLRDGKRARNGFVALAELDDNRDGRIDVRDPAFADLVLWSDHDADKTSTLTELEPLALRGVVGIDLGYVVDPACDDRGNCEVQRATFTFLERGCEVRKGSVIDVVLACQ